MTCFWKGLMQCLNKNDFNLIQSVKPKKEIDFVKVLKKKNKITENVTWQNEILSEKFKQECFQCIQTFDINSIYNGYLCSTCDPFLILVSELFCVNINHSYCGHTILYKNKKSSRIFYVSSNKNHFKKINK